MPSKWTSEEDQKIRHWSGLGLSFQQIADYLDRDTTADAVRMRLRRITGPTDEARPKTDIKGLERIVEKQAATIDRLRSSRGGKIEVSPAKRPRGSYCRVVVGDTHGCLSDHGAVSAFIGDLAYIKPREVVLLGDHLDCGGFLAQHHAMGYVCETDYTFEDDVLNASEFLDKVQENSPGASYHYLEGNHEHRVEKFLVGASLRNPKDSKYLNSLFSPKQVLSLDKRGVNYYTRSETHMGISLPGTIRLGLCYFTHGFTSAKHAADKALRDIGGNVVFGHIHRQESRLTETIGEGTIGAWSVGCLCQKIPLWRHTAPTGWTHGYGLQFVKPDGMFLHLNIPIINGSSLLVPLAEKIV